MKNNLITLEMEERAERAADVKFGFRLSWALVILALVYFAASLMM